MRRLRALVVHAASSDNATFSYQIGWPDAFARDPRFASTLVNVAARGVADRLGALWRVKSGRFDVVLLLHSVFSNARLLDGRLFEAVRAVPAPKVYFIGNEYKLMPEKMAFAQSLGIALLVSQSSSPRVHEMYRARLGCQVAGIPNTGVDPALFRPTSDPDTRPIDLGYRADDAPVYLGHNERRLIAECFRRRAPALGLRADISLNPADRFAGADWAAFLNRCRGQLGTEAGGDYFSLTDQYRHVVNPFVAAHPEAGFDEVYNRFFRPVTDNVPLRIISGRNVEAAATRTVQLLFEGEYDGYLQADEHYIPLRKDFGNFDDAVEKFRDPAFCRGLADNAYELAMREFTYDRLIGRVHDAVAPLT
jgi:hypothetical protein